jgi:predicted pyridoxine 5'-phosphate oxidase superfamily flavin-nucleotide-binding protein
MLTPDMKRIVEEQRLGFVATAAADGTPNVTPKGTFVVLDDVTIAFGEIRSGAASVDGVTKSQIARRTPIPSFGIV